MTIIGLVAAGLGVSVLPASYQRMRIDGVVYRPLLDPEAVSAVWLVQRKDQKSPMAKAFVELLTRKVEPSKLMCNKIALRQLHRERFQVGACRRLRTLDLPSGQPHQIPLQRHPRDKNPRPALIRIQILAHMLVVITDDIDHRIRPDPLGIGLQLDQV